MTGAILTFRYGADFNEARVREVAEGARGRFTGMPGLRSKAFTVDAEKREAISFYLWDSLEAARAFYTPELLERVTGLYGVRPTVQLVRVVALVDNARAAAAAAGS